MTNGFIIVRMSAADPTPYWRSISRSTLMRNRLVHILRWMLVEDMEVEAYVYTLQHDVERTEVRRHITPELRVPWHIRDAIHFRLPSMIDLLDILDRRRIFFMHVIEAAGVPVGACDVLDSLRWLGQLDTFARRVLQETTLRPQRP